MQKEDKRAESQRRVRAANEIILNEVNLKDEFVVADLVKKDSDLFRKYRQCLWDYKYAATNFDDLKPEIPRPILDGLRHLSLDNFKLAPKKTSGFMSNVFRKEPRESSVPPWEPKRK